VTRLTYAEFEHVRGRTLLLDSGFECEAGEIETYTKGCLRVLLTADGSYRIPGNAMRGAGAEELLLDLMTIGVC
jgi:hypothetical protein